MFHAAQANLYARGISPTPHGEVRREFGQYIVLEGDAARKDGRLLGELYDYRLEADYGDGTRPDDIERLVSRVDGFLCRMNHFVTSQGDE